MTDYVPFYRYSLDNARHYNEVDGWWASHKANIDCVKAIENGIDDNYKEILLSVQMYYSLSEFEALYPSIQFKKISAR